MKKWQLGVTVVVLLALVGFMNSIAQMRQEKAKAAAKAVADAKQAAEMKAAEAKNAAEAAKKPKVALPKPWGLTTAPIKIEVMINSKSSCHASNTSGTEVFREAYGKLVRIEWSDYSNPQTAKRADQLRIGCEASLVINGKVEYPIEKNGGRVVVNFRGPADKAHYSSQDVFLAINAMLKEKGITPPPAALSVAAGKPAPKS